MTGTPPTRTRLLSVAPAVAAAARGRHNKVRLTRRGRVVIVLVVVLGALVVFGLGRASAGDSSAATRPSGAPTVAVVTVSPGDTLWSLAGRLWPRADRRDSVRDLVRANHLSEGAALVVGTDLRLP